MTDTAKLKEAIERVERARRVLNLACDEYSEVSTESDPMTDRYKSRSSALGMAEAEYHTAMGQSCEALLDASRLVLAAQSAESAVEAFNIAYFGETKWADVRKLADTPYVADHIDCTKRGLAAASLSGTVDRGVTDEMVEAAAKAFIANKLQRKVGDLTATDCSVYKDDIRAALEAALSPGSAPQVSEASFQARVGSWMQACFGPEISADRQERNHRFLEEAIELVQACGATRSEAHQLVDYVYGRTRGEPAQEAGGVMVTLAALCLANGFDMHSAAEAELGRVWTKIEKIRAKQAAKPKQSPLPEAAP